MPYSDPEKRKVYCKAYHEKWYACHRKKRIAQVKEYKRKRRAKTLTEITLENDERKNRVCCRCGVVYGKLDRRHKSDNSWEPCHKCAPIIERKRAARVALSIRSDKREMSKFGKWLLAEQDRLKDELQEERNQGSECNFETQLFDAFRYVSQDEIDEARNKLRSNGCLHCDGQYLEIMRRTGSGFDFDGFIAEPGFYRVEPCSDEYGRFWRKCSGGLPWAANNRIVHRFSDYRRELQRKADERMREEHKREIQKRIEAMEAKRKERIAWSQPCKGSTASLSKSVQQFFTAMAMMGLCRSEITTNRKGKL